MLSSYFQANLITLSPTQQSAWESRRQMAEDLLDRHTDLAHTPDAETVAHLQCYIDGDITLGQAMGRILDRWARSH